MESLLLSVAQAAVRFSGPGASSSKERDVLCNVMIEVMLRFEPFLLPLFKCKCMCMLL